MSDRVVLVQRCRGACPCCRAERKCKTRPERAELKPHRLSRFADGSDRLLALLRMQERRSGALRGLPGRYMLWFERNGDTSGTFSSRSSSTSLRPQPQVLRSFRLRADLVVRSYILARREGRVVMFCGRQLRLHSLACDPDVATSGEGTAGASGPTTDRRASARQGNDDTWDSNRRAGDSPRRLGSSLSPLLPTPRSRSNSTSNRACAFSDDFTLISR